MFVWHIQHATYFQHAANADLSYIWKLRPGKPSMSLKESLRDKEVNQLDTSWDDGVEDGREAH